MLLPRFALHAAAMFGIDGPIAPSVRPMMRSDRPEISARSTSDVEKRCEPNSSNAAPRMNVAICAGDTHTWYPMRP